MESIMKDLWYGNIIPQNDCRPQTEEFKELSELILRHKRDLTFGLNDQQLEIFDKLDACWTEYISLSEEAIFAYAFKLGMRVAIETLSASENDE